MGAGLPIMNTVAMLANSGDKIQKIEGILSGTLSYIFNTYDGSMPFSEVVKQAKALGYTEPDPRDDLSGSDVARKVGGYMTEHLLCCTSSCEPCKLMLAIKGAMS